MEIVTNNIMCCATGINARQLTRALVLLLLLSLVAGSTGCVTSVTPPIDPQDPVKVYLTDEYFHSSVLLPLDDHGKYVEFAYADWNYAALNNTWPHDAIMALFFSKQSTFGRRYMTIDPAKTPMAPELAGVSVTGFYVDRSNVKTVLAELEAFYASGNHAESVTESGFTWVKVEGNYSLLNNCNTRTKKSLNELHCKVSSRSVLAMYWIDTVPPPAALSQKPSAQATASPAVDSPAKLSTHPLDKPPAASLSQANPNRPKTVGTR